MTQGVRIRTGCPEDAGAVLSMLTALAGELGLTERFASNEAAIRQHGHGARPLFSTQIAEAEAPVGLALYFPHFSTMRGRPGVYVQDLWTAPGMRGQGLGSDLLAAVSEAAARDWGAAYMALSVHGHNAGAERFYARLGFEPAPDERPVILGGQGFAALAAKRKATA
jgi:GNAT superfamily N-acetyltransferase